MLNRVILMGRLTRDPELRQTQSGLPVASFSLAVERDFKGQNSERETDFIDFVAWRSTAEFVSKYFSKGRMAVVDGKLQTRTWKDSDGKTRKAVEVVVDSIHFGDSKKDDVHAAAPQQPAYSGNYHPAAAPIPRPPVQSVIPPDIDDSRVPF